MDNTCFAFSNQFSDSWLIYDYSFLLNEFKTKSEYHRKRFYFSLIEDSIKSMELAAKGNRVFSFHFFFFLICFSTWAEDQKQKSDKVVMQLPDLQLFQFAGYIAAKEKGFYRDNGLNVEFQVTKPDSPPDEMILSGNANFGTMGPDILLKRVSGKPVIVLAVIFQHSASGLLVRRDSHISNPKDLIGRKVMLEMNQRDAEFIAMFRAQKITPDRMNVMRNSGDLNDLIDRKVDAMEIYATTGRDLLRARGVTSHIIQPRHYGIDFYGDCLFTSEKEIKENPERVEAFREATLQGWRFAMDNPDEIVDIILKQNGASEKGISREKLRYEAESMREFILPDIVPIGHMNPERWKKMAETYASLGMIGKNYSLENFSYDASGNSISKRVPLILSAISFILLLIGGILIWTFQLKRQIARHTESLQKKNEALVTEMVERRQVDKALKESEERFNQLSENIDAIFWILDPRSYKVIYTSPAFEKLFGRPPVEVFHKPARYLETIFPDDRLLVLNTLKSHSRGKQTNVEYRIQLSDGSVRWLWDRAFPILNKDGSVYRVAGIASDITDKKKSERIMRATVREKEIMLKEIHHRVKNNLQVVISLLSLQISSVPEIETKALLIECQSRFRSMALVHEELYQSRNLSEINFAVYSERLIKNLHKIFRMNDSVSIRTDIVADQVGVDLAIPCGLIITELLSNALKYAFPGTRTGEIFIGMRTLGDNWILEINDNGIGFPGNLDFRKTKSLGLQLVNILSEQISGELALVNHGGASFTLTFPKRKKYVSESSVKERRAVRSLARP